MLETKVNKKLWNVPIALIKNYSIIIIYNIVDKISDTIRKYAITFYKRTGSIVK